ncbi:hypothetical protein C1H46_038301 [Malus baccata]|uniref:Mono-/di-acylglycerol lipase N-terminal domain-containing protein n=1 Tax=Malus baccata TaxID=106549 RepID=A0A540KPM9_MALBA|nr:hypothetical protein C1H46_038301 [Malus baccata]
MAAGSVATAAGVAVILYYVFNRRGATKEGGVEDGDDNGDRSENLSKMRSARKRLSRRPAQAPATWVESLTTLSDTLRFTYSETLGKWPIGDLAFGIKYLMRRQGNLQVASVYAGSDSVQLKGSGIIEELKYYLKLLTLCMLFSKKPFPVFLESGGFSQEDVLLQKPKAGISVKELSACITWELAESGKHFITTIINGSDLVPTFSAASVDDLRSEVIASSWLNDLRDQVEHTRVLNVVYRSANALGSRLPSIASAKARVAGAGALLRPVSSSTQIVMKRAQNVVVRTHSSISSWSCMGARRRNVSPLLNSKADDLHEDSLICEKDSEYRAEGVIVDPMLNNLESSSSGGLGHDDSDEEEQLLPVNRNTATSTVEDITEGELWYELEKELKRQEDEVNVEAREEEAAAVKEITEEEDMLVGVAESNTPISSSDVSENHRFFPPGRIMHIISVPSSDDTNLDNDGPPAEERVGIYETRRELYSKLRLSRTMINDHYMPMYKKMVELLIRELENDESSNCIV